MINICLSFFLLLLPTVIYVLLCYNRKSLNMPKHLKAVIVSEVLYITVQATIGHNYLFLNNTFSLCNRLSAISIYNYNLQ